MPNQPITIIIPVLDLLDGVPAARLVGVDEIDTIRRYARLLRERLRALHPGVDVDVRFVRDAAALARALAANDPSDQSVGRIADQTGAIAAELWAGPAWVRLGAEGGWTVTED